MDKMLLGGEGIVKGFEKRHPLRRRVPKFWVPVLRRSVVHSEVLGTYMPVIVTERVIQLIHENHGFDYYLLNVSMNCTVLYHNYITYAYSIIIV
jgi:hypothetical protein